MKAVVPLTRFLSPHITHHDKDMDVSDLRVGQSIRVRDELAEKCQKCFRDFLTEFADEEEDTEARLMSTRGLVSVSKYLDDALDLVQPERNTLFVNFEDLERFDQRVATIIVEQYYRVYPALCRGECMH